MITLSAFSDYQVFDQINYFGFFKVTKRFQLYKILLHFVSLVDSALNFINF